MQNKKRKRWANVLWRIGFVMFFFCTPIQAQASAAEPIVVVLDPGHGGENLGAEYGAYTEKEMTLILAEAMKKELEKYEDIKVYMTREEDKDMSLEQRVDYAVSVDADFLFCLHFNMSAHHNLFGAEVWVSAFDEEYSKGYSFASVMMDMFTEKGLYSRGIKTKLNEEGADYYGILRHSQANDLPAALIEHCHLDHKNDQLFYGTDEQLQELGRLDAAAVAKYYGLKSEELGVDYSGYQNAEIPVPKGAVKPDKTMPDICAIDVLDVADETGTVTVSVSAEDYDSYILYYSYSYNGGKNFSDLQKWEPKNADKQIFTIEIPEGMILEIVVRAYNGFDIFKESNHCHLPPVKYGENAVTASTANAEIGKPKEGDKGQAASAETSGASPAFKSAKTDNISAGYYLLAALTAIAVWLTWILFVKLSNKKRRRKK